MSKASPPAPKTLLEAVTYFANPVRAHVTFVKTRWPNGVACPRMGCGSAAVMHLSSETRPRFRCKDCKRDFTAKVGTIFEDSPIALTKWLPAIWLLSNAKNGISSCELARALGVTQKTAWFMLHRVRVAMRLGSFEPPLIGEVEADETYVGGREAAARKTRAGKARTWHGPSTGKTTIFGMVERGLQTRVRAAVVPDNKRSSLLPKIQENVVPGSLLITDALRSYRNLEDYQHAFVDHMVTYVEGRVHTNTIENFWSCLKRTIHGTYIAPRGFHLDAYLAEQVFRFNERFGDDAARFAVATKAADGQRLTYRALIGKNTTRPPRRLQAPRKVQG